MKISTWNVNGLRAVLTKGALKWVLEEQPDVLCLQEIKVKPEVILGGLNSSGSSAAVSQVASPASEFYEAYQACLGDYAACWNPAERPGYSGVATFYRLEALEAQCGLGLPAFDPEGRVVMTRFPGLRLFNVYFPNGQRGRERVQYKLDFYAALLELCDQLHAQGEQIIICGDFNTAHQEIDLKNPKANAQTSGFLPEERVWIDHYLAHGFVDAYRALYPQRVQYTWWTYRMGARQRNIGWRLDYFLVSQSLLPAVQEVIVHEEYSGSDHCPVSLVLDWETS